MTRKKANLLLLVAACLWGTTFVAQQAAMAHVGPLLYTGLRFALGGLVIAPLALREWQKGLLSGPFPWFEVLGLGLLLTGGIVLQQIGVAATLVGNAGFLTTLYIPLVPLLTWLLWRVRPPARTLPLTAVALVGSYLLTGGVSTLHPGDLWIIASTFFWAGHLLLLARVTQRAAPFLLALGQYTVCTLLTTFAGLLLEPWDGRGLLTALPHLLYGGVLSVGIAFTLQVIALRHTQPFDAAAIMASEALFAALAGYVLLNETLGLTQWLGGTLILIAVVAIQRKTLPLPPTRPSLYSETDPQ